MGIEVLTLSTCDMCGGVDKRRGAEDECPIGWAILELSYRLDGSGWENNTRYKKELCQNCANSIRDFAKLNE